MNTTILLGLDNSHTLCDYRLIPPDSSFCPFVLQVLSLNMSSNHHNYSAEHRNDEMRVCSFCHNLVYKLAMEIFRHCFKETLYLGFVFFGDVVLTRGLVLAEACCTSGVHLQLQSVAIDF